MAREEHLQSDADIEAILKIAVREDHTSGDLRARLQASAQELGVSPEALAVAEAKWREQRELELVKQKDEELFAEYRKEEIQGFKVHLFWYLAVNSFLLCVNLFTRSDGPWFLGPVMGWGIGLAFHLIGTYWPDKSSQQEGFRKWKEKARLPLKG